MTVSDESIDPHSPGGTNAAPGRVRDPDAAPRVVVDTNIIVQSPRLNSGAWRAALQAHLTHGITLHVPEVCLIEAAAWVRREMPARLSAFEKARNALEQVGLRISNDHWNDDALGVHRNATETVDGSLDWGYPLSRT